MVLQKANQLGSNTIRELLVDDRHIRSGCQTLGKYNAPYQQSAVHQR
jgi:hypothetical protein